MAYVKIQDGIVVQKQPNQEDGFIEVGDEVICGMVYDGEHFAIVPPELSQEEKTSLFERAIQAKLNEKSRSMGYDSIETAVTYAEESAVEKFQQEGAALRTWRSLVWGYAYEQLALVLSGQLPEPTVEDFIEELPAFQM